MKGNSVEQGGIDVRTENNLWMGPEGGLRGEKGVSG